MLFGLTKARVRQEFERQFPNQPMPKDFERIINRLCLESRVQEEVLRDG